LGRAPHLVCESLGLGGGGDNACPRKGKRKAAHVLSREGSGDDSLIRDNSDERPMPAVGEA